MAGASVAVGAIRLLSIVEQKLGGGGMKHNFVIYADQYRLKTPETHTRRSGDFTYMKAHALTQPNRFRGNLNNPGSHFFLQLMKPKKNQEGFPLAQSVYF